MFGLHDEVAGCHDTLHGCMGDCGRSSLLPVVFYPVDTQFEE
jgi:hypothetical protein